MRRAWQAFVAEAVAVCTDAGAVLVLVVAVGLYAFVYPTPYAAGVLQQLPVAVVDEDHSATSRQLARMLDAHQLLAVTGPAGDARAAEREVRAGRIAGYLVVPRDFERDLLRGERATLAAFIDATYVLSYRQALAGVLEVAGTLSAGAELRRAQARGATPAQAALSREPFHVVTRPLFNATESYATYIVPGVLVLIFQQTLLVGIGLVAGTRTERARARSLLPGARPADDGLAGAALRVLGRTAFYLALYGVHAAIGFALVFGAHGFAVRAAAPDLAWLMLPYLLAAILLAQALGALAGERETAMFALVWTSLPAVFLAGFAWPREAMPAWLVAAGHLLPSTPAIDGALRLTQLGARVADVAPQVSVLWALACAYALLAVVAGWWREARLRGDASA